MTVSFHFLPQWVGDDVGSEGAAGAAALASAVRALSELVSRRRLARHALLGAALRLRVPAAAAPAPSTGSPVTPLALGVPGALLAAAAAGAAAALVRRRRVATAAERSRRRDEEKSNNLQNEENLRRYANPLREPATESRGGHGGHGGGGGAGAGEELPRAHSLYKAQNADARNDTPPRDKELTKRALPPPEPPPSRHAPPERLTVLV